MALLIEPTIFYVLFLSLLFIVSGVIILVTLRKFKMRIASYFFTFFLVIIGSYIPFYFIGTLVMNAVKFDSNPNFSFFFLKNQMELLNTPFAFFESASLIVDIIAILAAIALIIATVFVVKVVIKAIGKARYFQFDVRAIKCNFIRHTYIPNHHNTYLVIHRLRN